MPEQEMTQVEVPEEWMRWGLGGAATAIAGGALALGKWFRGDLKGLEQRTERTFTEVREEIHALGARTERQFDDLWEVQNAEREAASRARERNYERLEKTPTREEMQAGLRDVKAEVGKLAELIREGKK